MLAPPKQRVEIAAFDPRTLENFRLPEGQNRGNLNAQGVDDFRKKKKVCETCSRVRDKRINVLCVRNLEKTVRFQYHLIWDSRQRRDNVVNV